MFSKRWMNEKTLEELKKDRKNILICGVVYMIIGAAYMLMGVYAHYSLGLSVTALISIIIGAMAAIMGNSLTDRCSNISIMIYMKENNMGGPFQ